MHLGGSSRLLVAVEGYRRLLKAIGGSWRVLEDTLGAVGAQFGRPHAGHSTRLSKPAEETFSYFATCRSPRLRRRFAQ